METMPTARCATVTENWFDVTFAASVRTTGQSASTPRPRICLIRGSVRSALCTGTLATLKAEYKKRKAERRMEKEEDQQLELQVQNAEKVRNVAREKKSAVAREEEGGGRHSLPHSRGGGCGRRSRSRSKGRSVGVGKRRLKGMACLWNVRGFCFIKPEDGGEDLFCHVSSIKVLSYRVPQSSGSMKTSQ
jgi:hypothetical protein